MIVRIKFFNRCEKQLLSAWYQKLSVIKVTSQDLMIVTGNAKDRTF